MISDVHRSLAGCSAPVRCVPRGGSRAQSGLRARALTRRHPVLTAEPGHGVVVNNGYLRRITVKRIVDTALQARRPSAQRTPLARSPVSSGRAAPLSRARSLTAGRPERCPQGLMDDSALADAARGTSARGSAGSVDGTIQRIKDELKGERGSPASLAPDRDWADPPNASRGPSVCVPEVNRGS